MSGCQYARSSSSEPNPELPKPVNRRNSQKRRTNSRLSRYPHPLDDSGRLRTRCQPTPRFRSPVVLRPVYCSDRPLNFLSFSAHPPQARNKLMEEHIESVGADSEGIVKVNVRVLLYAFLFVVVALCAAVTAALHWEPVGLRAARVSRVAGARAVCAGCGRRRRRRRPHLTKDDFSGGCGVAKQMVSKTNTRHSMTRTRRRTGRAATPRRRCARRKEGVHLRNRTGNLS